MGKKTFPLWAVVFAVTLATCRSPEFSADNDATLNFTSYIGFDTLLAPMGSVTGWFTVHNRSRHNILINQISLLRGDASPFIINIDGQPQYAAGVRLAKYDSMFIFVAMRRDATSDAMRTLSDSVVFTVNGNAQYFPLSVCARGATVWRDTIITQDVYFRNSLPHLFTGNVTIADNVVAVIDSGCEMLFDYAKGMVVKGRLQVRGSAERPVLFAHTRYRDPWYAYEPGQWAGLAFGSTSADNEIAHVTITGATRAIYVEDTLQTNGSSANLTLRRCTLLHNGVKTSPYDEHYKRLHLFIRGGRAIIDSCTFFDTIINDTIFVNSPDPDSAVCL
jgi:hypothetical protein